jgi:hypothetical protein
MLRTETSAPYVDGTHVGHTDIPPPEPELLEAIEAYTLASDEAVATATVMGRLMVDYVKLKDNTYQGKEMGDDDMPIYATMLGDLRLLTSKAEADVRMLQVTKERLSTVLLHRELKTPS